MDWKEFNRKHKIGIKWGVVKRLTKRFLEKPLNDWDFIDEDDSFIDFSDKEYCYSHIFNHFLGGHE